MSILLCLAMVLAFLPALPVSAVDANDVIPQLHYGEYDTLSMIYDQGDCYSMQGMTLDANYTYCAKIGDNDGIAAIIRTSKTTGNKTVMTNGDNGSYYFYNLGHANALDMTYANGYNQILVTAGATLVRLKMNGSTLYTAGTYTATYNGATASMTAVQVMSASDTAIKVLVKTGRTLYTGTLDPTVSSGNIALTKLCTLNLSSARLKGQVYDFSSYVQQGFDFHDNKVFLPLSGTSVDTSIVLVYDLQGANGDIKNDPTLSFRVISGTYAALFEIEDVAVCQVTGKLYFNTNRRKSNSDTDYDSCSYFLDFSYDPSMSTIAPADYRWETVNNELVPVMQGGGTYNLPTMFHGSITDNVMDQALYSLNRSVMLKHDAPWVVEWKSSGSFTGGALLLSTGKHSMVPNAPFLFRYKESNLVALGYYTGSQHNNYGIRLSDHGIDGTAEHTYRLTNKVSGSSNMVYLSVDGQELGAMNNYYIGVNSQGTTSDWVSGQDFTFSYIGAYNHPITDCKLDYLQVWANGEPDTTAKAYRWNTTGDQLTAATDSGYTANNATIFNGTVTGTTYTNAAFRLDQTVTLRHNRPWSIEWEAEGTLTSGSFLLSAAEGNITKYAPFLFRYGTDGFIAIGSYDGSRHNNYGLKLSDYGIDPSAKHTYRLNNQIASDGSNMVYLYVDGTQVGPMNQAHNGLNPLGTTSDWLNGKDLSFDYIGNRNYSLHGTINYMLVDEGVQTQTGLVEFRDYNGDLLSSQSYPYGTMPTVPADPVRKADSKYSYTFTGWSPEITAVSGDVTYIATYDSHLQYYTVTFQNDDGTVLSTQSLGYGVTPTAPADPTKPSANGLVYTFSGWSPAIGRVKGDTVYTATYTCAEETYTVIFCNDDGTVLSTQQLKPGETPTAPAAPTKAPTVSHSYSFVGWGTAIGPVYADTTYTARYVSSLRKYTVTFCNYDGTVISTQLTPYGYTPTAPATNPTRPADRSNHYLFSDWSPAVGSISGETTYTAAYQTVAHSFRTATTAPTCTATGKTTYTCNACGYSYSQTIAATGHSYANGTCTTCGAQDPNHTVAQPSVSLKYPTLVFEDVITMNVYFSATNLQDVAQMGLITYSQSTTNVNVNTADAVVPGYVWSDADGLYYASTEGIAAKNLGDTIYFAVYARLTDGSYYYSRLVPYSPETYAYAQLSSGSAEMKPLVVAMLNYGAAAQTYFSYNTDKLVNRNLTDAQKAMVEDYRADMMTAVPAVTAAKQGTFTANGGFARRYPTISFEGAFSINYYCTPSAVPKGGITLYYWNQSDFNKASVLAQSNATTAITMTGSGTGEYHAAIEGIAAKDLDQGIYVCFTYTDGTTTYYSGVLAYSIGTYCNVSASGNTTLTPFAKATAVYGYYAKDLFY